MDPVTLDHYLDTTQNIILLDDDEELLAYIAEQKKKYSNDARLASFFSAEEAFYQRQYKNALKHYLNARSVPRYRFFCFRASAYVSKMMSSYAKGIQFAKKALRIKPDDYTSLTLLEELYRTVDEKGKAAIVKEKIDSIKTAKTATKNDEEEILSYIPVGMQELDELNSIFAESTHGGDTLFDLENFQVAKQERHTDGATPGFSWRATPSEFMISPRSAMSVEASTEARIESPCLTERLYPSEEPEEYPDTSDLPNFFTAEPPTPSGTKEGLSSYHRALNDYSKSYRKRPSLGSSFCLFFEGCSDPSNPPAEPFNALSGKPSYGYFISWNGFGIAVNPSPSFLRDLHRQGLFIRDIDAVILTHYDDTTSSTLHAFLDLHKKTSNHPINLYFHSPELYDLPEEVPSDAIHSLCAEADYGLPLNEEIIVTFASHILHFSFGTENERTLVDMIGCRPLPKEDTGADIVIASMDQLSEITGKSTQTRLFVAARFTQEQLFHRLAAIKKLRTASAELCTVLPAENGLHVDLETLHVLGSDKATPLPLEDVAVVMTDDTHPALRYLPASHILNV